MLYEFVPNQDRNLKGKTPSFLMKFCPISTYVDDLENVSNPMESNVVDLEGQLGVDFTSWMMICHLLQTNHLFEASEKI